MFLSAFLLMQPIGTTFVDAMTPWLRSDVFLINLAVLLGSLANIFLVPPGLWRLLRYVTQKESEENASILYSKDLAETTLKSIGDAVVTTDAKGRVVWLNPVAEKLTGWTALECKGVRMEEMFQIFDENTREPIPNPALAEIALGRVVGIPENTILISRQGDEYSITGSAAPIRNHLGSEILGSVTIFHNQTQTRELTREIVWHASHDSLTRLMNRHEFEKLIDAAIKELSEPAKEHIVCFLDLDQFKLVNDISGHLAGDALLQKAAAILLSNVRSSDVVARRGGDEFAILLYDASIEVGFRVAEAIRAELAALRFCWEDDCHSIGVSIGITAITEGSLSFAEVLQEADSACYSAKEKGRNRVHINVPGDLELKHRQGEVAWVGRIDDALDHGRFELFFQSIKPLQADLIDEHYEVLLRMVKADGSLIPPGAFIPAAERFGRMVEIDKWVIHRLFETQAETYRRHWEQGKHCLYAINLSGQSLNDEQFAVFLEAEIKHFQIPPDYLCFEVTETAAIFNLATASKFIQRLRELGCKTALDDFGVGYCSFSYLQVLSVDFLKIDGGFVQRLLSSDLDEEIVRSMVNIAKAQKIQTIAEFVENDAVIEKLRSLGVNYAQGYGIDRPTKLLPSSS